MAGIHRSHCFYDVGEDFPQEEACLLATKCLKFLLYANKLGFAKSWEIPYIPDLCEGLQVYPLNGEKAFSSYLMTFGWMPAVKLPYNFSQNRLVVRFAVNDVRFKEAIEAGWYPAEDIDGLF